MVNNTTTNNNNNSTGWHWKDKNTRSTINLQCYQGLTTHNLKETGMGPIIWSVCELLQEICCFCFNLARYSLWMTKVWPNTWNWFNLSIYYRLNLYNRWQFASSLQKRKINSQHMWRHLKLATDTNWSNSPQRVHNIQNLKSQGGD